MLATGSKPIGHFKWVDCVGKRKESLIKFILLENKHELNVLVDQGSSKKSDLVWVLVCGSENIG